MSALEDFGFGALGLAERDFVEPDVVIQLGYPPARIDLLTSLSGVDFDTCYRARVVEAIDGLHVPFIRLDDLLRNKRVTGRLQALADVEALQGRTGDAEDA